MRTPVLVALLASGCFLKLPPVLTPAPTVVEPMLAPAAVSFSELEQRVDVLLGDTDDADRRDRLVQLRELMYAMRGKDPTAQAKVFRYVTAVVEIEERDRVIEMPMEDFGVGIPAVETGVPISPVTPPPTPPPAEVVPVVPLPPAPVDPVVPVVPVAASVDRAAILDGTRAALAAGRYRDAVALVNPLADAEARMLRQEAVDGLARSERERAGAMFLSAKALPLGEERTRTLRQAADLLRSVNADFPDNAFARQIAENLALIEAESKGAP